MQIVVEAIAVFAHAFVEFLFAGVAEGRMPDVVHERERFGKIAIDVQRAGNGAGDLRHFESVREPVAEMIGKTHGENLRFGFQPAERARMNDAIAVTRVVVTVGMRRLGIAAPARLANVHRIRFGRHRTHSSVSPRMPAMLCDPERPPPEAVGECGSPGHLQAADSVAESSA